MKRITRRRFVQTTAPTSAAAVAPNIITSNALGANGVPAAMNATLAGIGMGGQGNGDLGGFMSDKRIQVLAYVTKHGDLGAHHNRVNGHHRNLDCAAHPDYREICAREDIDAILAQRRTIGMHRLPLIA